ncbi:MULTISPECIES: 5-methylcytosine restriction system specificity protein McrC [unclassified Bacillus cereus group]|uniref:5-methylcytosine restriction system specificity protein McrC n=1 Tax=Bacillus cereus group TaxID=86661 RepID=UPI0009B5502C
MFVDNRTSHIIIDTKWKSLITGNRSEVKWEDLFQIYVYLTGYHRIQIAILLYPQQ